MSAAVQRRTEPSLCTWVASSKSVVYRSQIRKSDMAAVSDRLMVLLIAATGLLVLLSGGN